jgi:hypothetical protein
MVVRLVSMWEHLDMGERLCFISQLGDERSPWDIPVNECRAWAYVLGADSRHAGNVLDHPEILQEYRLVMVELTANLYGLPAFIKRHAPGVVVVGLLEGAVGAVGDQTPEEQVEFVHCVQALDLLGVLLEESLPYYRLFVDPPQKAQWLGIPYPKAWTDSLAKREPDAKERLVELGASLDPGRNGLPLLRILHRLREVQPKVRGRAYYGSKSSMHALGRLDPMIDACPQRSWNDYYVHHLDAYLVLSLDPRRTWGRLVLDCASACVPYVGSDVTHCARAVGVLTCNPFDVETAYRHAASLLQDRDLYNEVVHQQYERLAAFDEDSSRTRFWSSLQRVAPHGG